MPASGLTVLWLRGCVLMASAKAQNCHAAGGTTTDRMQSDNRDEQDGKGTMLHV